MIEERLMSSMRLGLVIFIFSLLTACVTSGLNLDEGIKSFQVQNYRQAFILLKPEAQRGQPDAQYAVGYMYYYGQGVVEDRKQAWYWINRAASAGQPDAMEAVKILQHP
jgi:TPR repeat protein